MLPFEEGKIAFLYENHLQGLTSASAVEEINLWEIYSLLSMKYIKVIHRVVFRFEHSLLSFDA